MSTELNPVTIGAICDHFRLGTPIGVPIRIYGGLLHFMWRVETPKATYAIKQLSKDIRLTDKRVVKNYELSESIASHFIAHGIPGVCALEQSGKHLFIIQGTGFLVYPWVDAKALDKDTISISQALEMARILSKIHRIDLQVQEMESAAFDIHDNEKIITLAQLAKQQNLSFAFILQKDLEKLLAINKNYHNAVLILKKRTVVSHGDLDQKNVLWNAKHPILIDWESARKLNPTYEAVGLALDWSGMSMKFDKALYIEILKEYKKAGGIVEHDMLEAAFYGVLGNWINWMVYNIQRAVNAKNVEQQKMGTEQVIEVLSTIARLDFHIEELMQEAY